MHLDWLQAKISAFPLLCYAMQFDSKYATEPGWVTGTSERFKGKNPSSVRSSTCSLQATLGRAVLSLCPNIVPDFSNLSRPGFY